MFTQKYNSHSNHLNDNIIHIKTLNVINAPDNNLSKGATPTRKEVWINYVQTLTKLDCLNLHDALGIIVGIASLISAYYIKWFAVGLFLAIVAVYLVIRYCFYNHKSRYLTSIEGFSDATVELIVAVLNAGDDQAHLKSEGLLVSPFQNDLVFQSDVSLQKRPPIVAILRELVEHGLLIESDGVYRVTSLAQRYKAKLIERDNLRIAKTLYRGGKEIFRQTRSRDSFIFCQLRSVDPLACWLGIYDTNNDGTTSQVFGQPIYTRQELFDAVKLMENAGLVEYWYSAKLGKDNALGYYNDPKAHYFDFENDTANDLKNLSETLCHGVVGRLTERGLQIARMFQKAKN